MTAPRDSRDGRGLASGVGGRSMRTSAPRGCGGCCGRRHRCSAGSSRARPPTPKRWSRPGLPHCGRRCPTGRGQGRCRRSSERRGRGRGGWGAGARRRPEVSPAETGALDVTGEPGCEAGRRDVSRRTVPSCRTPRCALTKSRRGRRRAGRLDGSARSETPAPSRTCRAAAPGDGARPASVLGRALDERDATAVGRDWRRAAGVGVLGSVGRRGRQPVRGRPDDVGRSRAVPPLEDPGPRSPWTRSPEGGRLRPWLVTKGRQESPGGRSAGGALVVRDGRSLPLLSASTCEVGETRLSTTSDGDGGSLASSQSRARLGPRAASQAVVPPAGGGPATSLAACPGSTASVSVRRTPFGRRSPPLGATAPRPSLSRRLFPVVSLRQTAWLSRGRDPFADRLAAAVGSTAWPGSCVAVTSSGPSRSQRPSRNG